MLAKLGVVKRGWVLITVCLCILYGISFGVAEPVAYAAPAGVRKLCTIQFDKDLKRPARVEDSALPCLAEAARKLHDDPGVKLVLVGIADPVKDWADTKRNGKERDTPDMTGLDIRYPDIASYRAVNAKLYLTHWYGIGPARILPTTDENLKGQEVIFYLVPGNADFNHNYLNTTGIAEDPCTVKPCFAPKDILNLMLIAQPRGRIQTTSTVNATK